MTTTLTDRDAFATSVGTVAVQLADHLTDLTATWTTVRGGLHDRMAVLAGPSGARLALRAEGLRWVVSGVHPDLPPGVDRVYGVDFGSVTVAGSRGVDQLAADIRTRLLPGYMLALEDAQHRIAAADAANQRRDTWTDRLRAVVTDYSYPREQQPTSGRRDIFLHLPHNGGYGKVEVSTYQGTSVSLELSSIAPELAEKLLVVLRDHLDTGATPGAIPATSPVH